MLKKVKSIELKNGQIMSQPDLEIDISAKGSASDGFLLVKHSGKLFYMNKDTVAGFEVIEQAPEPYISFE